MSDGCHHAVLTFDTFGRKIMHLLQRFFSKHGRAISLKKISCYWTTSFVPKIIVRCSDFNFELSKFISDIYLLSGIRNKNKFEWLLNILCLHYKNSGLATRYMKGYHNRRPLLIFYSNAINYYYNITIIFILHFPAYLWRVHIWMAVTFSF